MIFTWKPAIFIGASLLGVVVAQTTLPADSIAGYAGNLTALGFLGTSTLWMLVKTLPHILDKVNIIAAAHENATKAQASAHEEAIKTQAKASVDGIEAVCARTESDARRLEAQRLAEDKRMLELKEHLDKKIDGVKTELSQVMKHCAAVQERMKMGRPKSADGGE